MKEILKTSPPEMIALLIICLVFIEKFNNYGNKQIKWKFQTITF